MKLAMEQRITKSLAFLLFTFAAVAVSSIIMLLLIGHNTTFYLPSTSRVMEFCYSTELISFIFVLFMGILAIRRLKNDY